MEGIELLINTRNFGQLDVDEKMIISFDKGLPGFEEENEFVILNNWDTDGPVGFMWLQSVKNPDLAFVVSIPFLLRSNYEFELPEEVCSELNISAPSDVGVYTICRIEDKIENMTFNLQSPIIINVKDRRAAQIPLDDKRYSVAEKYERI
jgi:flagellar assembly factor FliW